MESRDAGRRRFFEGEEMMKDYEQYFFYHGGVCMLCMVSKDDCGDKEPYSCTSADRFFVDQSSLGSVFTQRFDPGFCKKVLENGSRTSNAPRED